MNRDLTINLALLGINILLGILCLMVARGARGPSVLRLWGCGMLVYVGGVAVAMSGIVVRSPVVPFLANAIICFAPILSVQAVLLHTSHRLPRKACAAMLAVAVVGLAFACFGGPLRFVAIITPATLIAIGLFTGGAFALLNDPPSHAPQAARWVAATMLIGALVWSLRLVYFWGVLGVAATREQADIVAALFGVVHLVSTVACTFGLFAIEVRRMEAVLVHTAASDPLTGLPNRRAATIRFHEEVARSMRRPGHFAMLVIDIDNFKQVNDKLGHLVGDAMIRQVAAALAGGKRQEDFLARIGGDEFVLLMEFQGREEALQVAQRVIDGVASARIEDSGHVLAVTVSGGIALYPYDGEDWDSLFSLADARLFASKHAGRNQVTTA
jgi:diguanylate cyclase (GGDEF)-like protein